MIGDKIKYTCKNCGWSTAIREEWADLKPKRCMNKKCNTSFEKNKDSLDIQLPEKEVMLEQKPTKKKSSKNEQPDE